MAEHLQTATKEVTNFGKSTDPIHQKKVYGKQGSKQDFSKYYIDDFESY